MVTYFLFDNVTIGGKNAPYDIYIAGIPFAEMKAGRYCKKTNSIDDFKLGKDQSRSSEYIVRTLGNFTAKTRFTIDNNAVANWRTLVLEETKSNMVSLIQTSDLKMRHFGPLSEDMVDVYRIHRNQPWVRISLPKE